ncbi:MAG: MoaD/ThiS family protein [Chloroflexota bacterium]|nr:MoaD/ThiS family protein [Chloroflexota bacterium]
MSDIIVSVRYFGVLQHYAGTKRVELTLPVGTTVSDFMQVLTETNTDAFRQALGNTKIHTSALRIFRNERLINGDAFEASIDDGDEFMLIPAISGG